MPSYSGELKKREATRQVWWASKSHKVIFINHFRVFWMPGQDSQTRANSISYSHTKPITARKLAADI